MAEKYIDWEFAKATGARLVPPGPKVSAAEAEQIVADIRLAAASAHDPVAATARLVTPDDAPAALVVDRPTWISVNADSMSAMLDPAFAKVMSGKAEQMSPTAQAIGSRVTGAEAGALLAFMGSKVLGQYDLAPGGTPALLLVAPNLVEVERELDLKPHDFRRWVCMHEETHRIQFTAVPWLRQHMIDSARGLAQSMTPDPQSLQRTVQDLGNRIPEILKGGSQGVIDLFIAPEAKAELARLTAIMSLLEGHADVVMDEVGPAVIPTVATIRSRFEERRKGQGAADRLLRRLLGLEAKMRQYRDGAIFVRGVWDRVGVDGFNQIWSSPQTLPRPEEIADPQAWVERVHR